METVEIHSITDLITFNDALPSDTFVCFRGQSDVSWDLVPSFYRGTQAFNPPLDDFNDGHWLGPSERDVYREFERRGRRYASDSWDFYDPWHRLILAQHFGVPTRLLDWTKNIFIACYFAVTSYLDRDAAIWCLNVDAFPFPEALGRRIVNGGYRIEALNSCTQRDDLCFLMGVSKPVRTDGGGPVCVPQRDTIPSKQSGNADRTGFLILLKPPVLEERIRSQKSLFTVYVSYEDSEIVWDHKRYIEEVERHHAKKLLTKLIIP
jgi:hypothetical protein